MKTLWITRDVDSACTYIWDTQPKCPNGKWLLSNGGNGPSCIIDLHAKLLLGDAWLDDGQFCFEIHVTFIKRVLSQPQTLANKLRAMTNETCCGETLIEAADLIESLSKK